MRFLSFLLCLITVAAQAQPALTTQAIITTKTAVIIPEGAADDGPRAMIMQQGGDGQQAIRRISDGGETESKTYVKGNMIKTVVENDMGRTSTLRDNAAKKTTTLMEMMGTRRGYYATDDDLAEMRRKVDSLQQQGPAGNANTVSSTDIVYVDESKTIAGYTCKKVLVLTTRGNGRVDTMTVWYNTAIKFDGLFSTGSSGGFGAISFGRNTNAAFEKIDGFVMQYENVMRRRRIIVEVTKIDVQKEIKDKEFAIDKDFDVKPMKDMQGADGRIQMRIGGPAPGGNNQ